MYRSFNSVGECMGGSQRGIAWRAEAAAQAHGSARRNLVVVGGGGVGGGVGVGCGRHHDPTTTTTTTAATATATTAGARLGASAELQDLDISLYLLISPYISPPQAHGWARQLSWELGPPPPTFKQA